MATNVEHERKSAGLSTDEPASAMASRAEDRFSMATDDERADSGRTGASRDPVSGSPKAELFHQPLVGQRLVSRLGDQLWAPLFSRRRQTMVLLSLLVLGILIYVALTQLQVDPAPAGTGLT
jgi:hypothetical protein